MTADTLTRVEIRWTAVCPYSRLEPDHGVAALVGGAQVAIFRTHDGQLYAIGHRDPISGRHVMSRGVVGTFEGAPTVASPTHKDTYDLRSGECLDVPGIRVPVYPVRCRDGVVEVGIYGASTSDLPGTARTSELSGTGRTNDISGAGRRDAVGTAG